MPTKKDPFAIARKNAKAIGGLVKKGAQALGMGPEVALADRRPNMRMSTNVEDRRGSQAKMIAKNKLKQPAYSNAQADSFGMDADFAASQKRIDDIAAGLRAKGGDAVGAYNAKTRANYQRSFVNEKAPKPRPKPAPKSKRAKKT